MFRITILLPLLLFVPVRAQNQCAAPEIQVRTNVYNIFNPEQEMALGELTYQKLSSEMRFVQDPELLAYVNNIGDRLIKHLPPTGLKFHFFIIDLPEANAFDVPGGYIFLSRKLIGFSDNEDELAGVMAHELGHAVVRHGAIAFSKQLKRVLNVTQVGDRKDIAEKYNLLIERWRTKSGSNDSGEDEQLEADHIGLFALIASGYDPTAFAEFFGRLTEAKGKSGNWFSDIFGKQKPEEKRMREMVKVSEEMPAQCRENRKAAPSQDFLKWQADVVSYHYGSTQELVPGLIWKKALAPRLRSDVWHVSFSADGKYFLAQDDSVISVIRSEPLEVVLQIPAPDAHEASFTLDGNFVVFGTKNLRHEKWSIADKKPVHIRELVVAHDCWEHRFSPDGNYLVCFDTHLNLNVYDTQTGKKVFQKEEFYRLTWLELLGWLAKRNDDDDDADQTKFFNIEFSPDSRYLLLARSNKSRFRFRVDAFVEDESEDTMLALDMTNLQKPLKTGGDLKKVTTRPFIFLDSHRVIGMISTNTQESGIFSFPDGKRLARFNFAAKEIKRTDNPRYVVIKPLTDAMMGLFDLEQGIIVSGANKRDADVWNDTILYESVSGTILLSKVNYNEQEKTLQIQTPPLRTIDIPVASLGEVRAAGLSDNLQWLAVSTRTRGAVWNLSSGDRKMFLRGFKGAFVANDGGAIGDFPKLESQNHALALLNPFTNEARSLRDVPDVGARQYGALVLLRESLKAPKKSDDKDKGKSADELEAAAERTLGREVRFSLKFILNDKVTWTREFAKEAPGYFVDPISGRMILYWSLGSDAGKARLKEDAATATRAKELGNKDDDYLIEIVDGYSGKTAGLLLIETGKGSFEIKNGLSDGDWLVLQDSTNRMLAYSISKGDLRQRFFGTNAALNPFRNQILVENYPGELTLFDLNSGDEVTRISVGTDAAFLRFAGEGSKLFVLNGDQTAFAFDVNKLVARQQ